MNATSDPRSFLEVFASVVEKHRDKDAIITEGRHKVTYGQLFSKACRIAQMLSDNHYHSESAGDYFTHNIGIGISKSADYIASMLGAWLAGVPFVPVDPQLPEERALYIINQLSMCHALVKDPAGSALSNLGVQPLVVDDDWTDDGCFLQIPKKALEIPADRLAYIIYTSGSTGRPKGVIVSHSGIWNFLSAQIEAFKFDEKSNSLFVLSTNFDASISDMGCALLAGSTLFIEPPGLLAPGPHFLDLLKERNISHMDVPPSLLKTTSSEHAPSTLKTIIIGGEVCAPDVVRSWAKKCLVVNVYGPTEATVCTSLGACNAETWDRPLIGQPLPNVEYLLLDENQLPVAQGTPGELYIGGIQLANGYVDEPALTLKKFVTLKGKRLYRTGDRVVQCSDGEYQFMGRIDRQFKLRGMLVEPEEIESRLADHRGIARAGVLKRPLRTGLTGEKLVAFVQPRDGMKFDANELKRHLSRSLPLWMVPQIFEVIEQIPTTATGKVDLTALHEIPLKAVPQAASSDAHKLTQIQSLLAEVWKQIFAVESAGIHDDFFELGGDSLNVIEAVLAAHIRGLTLSTDMLVAHPTIYDLSQAIENAKESDSNAGGSAENALESDFLCQDVTLDKPLLDLIESRKRPNYPQTEKLKNVLMTGTTGFLGSRLLYELLKNTDAKFNCLVRSPGRAEGLERIKHALSVHDLRLDEKDAQRIIVLPGDLAMPNFGWRDDQWHRLKLLIDTVIHCGASVNMIKDYFDLRPVNVLGTCEIARFMMDGLRKHLHYASTLSVFVATNHNKGVARENDCLERKTTVYGGYAQTKFACELLLRSIAKEAGPVSFYRFGLLTGDSHTGKSAKDDFLNMFARGLSTLGAAPESDSNMTVDITPVDYAAAAMAHIAVAGTKAGISNTYHIANEQSLSLTELLAVMDKIGCKLDVLPAEKFLSSLQTKADKFNPEESAACLALCRALGNSESFSQFRTMDLFQATDIQFDCTNTKKALEGTSIHCPKPSPELIEKYLRHVL
ncbi:MAG: amino acid adenylation domain-containing protein [Candidatus Melainabacteria bacterium]|nr:amino acid adenylation domain-containing protein [Candidatus Melainabacteria bacterium]